MKNFLCFPFVLVSVTLISACADSRNSDADVVGEQEVRVVLAEVARTAKSDDCDFGRLRAQIPDSSNAMGRRRNLEASSIAERDAASFALCGPRRHWALSTTAEFVGMQLAAAVLLQSRLPERERNPISIERNEKWAAILIQYARKFPTDREAAEKDWEMLEQGRRDLERRE